MRKKEERCTGWLSAVSVAVTFLLVIVMGLAIQDFTFISYADEEATVSVEAATIRKEASVSSEAIGSAMQGDSVTIKSEVTGADGMVWYQVHVNSETLGYIRSDLVTKADGSAPSNTAPPAAAAQVTEVQPQSATVTGGQGRIRSDASAGSNIVTTVQNDVVLTVTGQAVDSENVVWYRVVFIENGSEVTGFVRNDYVTLAGELVPVGEGDGQTPPADVPESSEPPADEPEGGDADDAPYNVQLVDGVWCLVNVEAGHGYEIEELLTGAEKNGELYEEARKTVNGQKIAIIILVILLVAAILAATLLFFKMKDVMDEAYFKAVEKETMRERGSSRKPGGAGRKVMQTVGVEPEKSEPPVRTKPAAAGRPGAQTRPAAGQGGQTAKPPVKPQSGAQPRTPGGQEQPPRQSQPRPASRPQGSVQGRPGAEQGQPPRQQPPRQAPHQDQRQPARGGAPRQSAVPEQPNPGWKSKNFMTDDDEFEFEFLNWDGEEN